MEYDVLLDNENKLEIEVELKDNEASYVIEGNENLQNESIVTIKVTSSDKSVTKEYKLNVKEKQEEVIVENNNVDDENNDTNDKKIYIIGISVFVIGFILFILAIKYKKKNNL